MKKIVLVVAMAFAMFTGNAQYFNVRPGAKMSYTQYDNTGKVTGHFQYQNEDTVTVDNAASAKLLGQKYTSDAINENGKFEKGAESSSILVEGKNSVSQYVDMKSNLGFMDMTMKGKFVEYPNNMKVGQKLEDFDQIVMGNFGEMEMSGIAHYTNRKVVGMEKVSVKSGIYNCMKVTEDIKYDFNPLVGFGSKSANTSSTSKRTVYVAEGVGVVKMVNADSQNKVESYNELTYMK